MTGVLCTVCGALIYLILLSIGRAFVVIGLSQISSFSLPK